MQEIVTTGRVTKGKLHVRNWTRIAAQIARSKDRELVITIAPKHATRSRQANAWYWACVVGLVAEHTGYGPDEIHEIYKAKFLPKPLTFADRRGVIIGEYVIGGTTSKLNVGEFYEYCERCRRWAGETLGVVIPDPDFAYDLKRKVA